jgi:hypothetical protein
MNFAAMNSFDSGTDTASNRRWQQVLALGCPAVECGSLDARQAGQPAPARFDVVP